MLARKAISSMWRSAHQAGALANIDDEWRIMAEAEWKARRMPVASPLCALLTPTL